MAFKSIQLGFFGAIKSISSGAEVVRECWKLYDERGASPDGGVAPWRTVLRSLGVNLLF